MVESRFFSGMVEIDNKRDQMFQIFFYDLPNLSHMSELIEQQLGFVCSHILKQYIEQSASTTSLRNESQDQNQCQAGAAPLSN